RASLRLRCEHGDEAHQIAGEAGPEARGDAPAGPEPRGLDAKSVGVHRAADVHAFEHRRHHFDVLAARPGDLDLAAGDGGDDRPASGFDVVAPQVVPRTAEPRAALDANRAGASARDADAQL